MKKAFFYSILFLPLMGFFPLMAQEGVNLSNQAISQTEIGTKDESFLMEKERYEYHILIGPIQFIQIWESHSGILVRPKGLDAILADGTRRDWAILQKSHPFYKEFVTLLYIALALKKDICLYLEKGSNVEGFLRITHMYIEKD